MKKYNAWWVAIVLLYVQLGCDGFTREIDVDYSNFMPKGVIFGVLSNTDLRDSAFRSPYGFSSSLEGHHANRVYISHSNPPGGWRAFYYKTKTSMWSENGAMRLSFVDMDDAQQYNYKAYYGVEEDLVPGMVYGIASEFDPEFAPPYVPAWEPVSAQDTMPYPVRFAVGKVHFDYEEGNYWATPRSGYFDIEIEDEQDRTNVYLIELSAIFTQDSLYDGDYFLVHGHIDPPDQAIDLDLFGNTQDNVFHEDDFTSEGKKRIHFRFNQSYGSHDREKGAVLFVRVSNLSGNYIRFQRSAQQYDSNDENPFDEPVEIYTNVENGYGIFALAARSYQRIEVK